MEQAHVRIHESIQQIQMQTISTQAHLVVVGIISLGSDHYAVGPFGNFACICWFLSVRRAERRDAVGGLTVKLLQIMERKKKLKRRGCRFRSPIYLCVYLIGDLHCSRGKKG